MTPLSLTDKINFLQYVDVVTVDTEGMPFVGLSVAFDGLDHGFYFPFNHYDGNLSPSEQKKVFKLLNEKEALVFHNAVHDLRVLARVGFDYRGPFYDTMLMSHWLEEELPDYALDALTKRIGLQGKAMPEQMSALIESDGWNVVPAEWMDLYSSNDSYITHKLFRNKLPRFQDEGFDGELWETEQKFIRNVMGPMMDLGIKVDLEFCIKEYLRGKGIMADRRKELNLNPNSPKDLERLLMVELGLPVLKHTKSCLKCYPLDKRATKLPVRSHIWRPAFDKEVMAEYEELLEKKNDHRAELILEYRGWSKTTSSNYKPYLELVDENGVLHPGYKLHGTRTSRLSCADPNLQQIPKASEKDWNGNLKKAFIAREGYSLWTIDYAQLQFRMTCAYAVALADSLGRLEETGVHRLLDIFNDPTRDIFTEMSSDMGWLRDNVKTLVYLILFGGGAPRAAVAFGVTESQGKELINEFYVEYPEIKAVAKEAENTARKLGYVTYWTGRRRHFPKGSAYYRAFNAVIQGGEAEIIKRAMIALEEEVCDENCRLILQIHDEVALEIAEGKEESYLEKAQAIMTNAGQAFCEYVGVQIDFKTSAKKWGEK